MTDEVITKSVMKIRLAQSLMFLQAICVITQSFKNQSIKN